MGKGVLLFWEMPIWGINWALRVVSRALNMVPNLLERVLTYGPLICVGYIRGM